MDRAFLRDRSIETRPEKVCQGEATRIKSRNDETLAGAYCDDRVDATKLVVAEIIIT